MKKFGSGISYFTVDLIRIYKSSSGAQDFEEKRDRYLDSQNRPADSIYRGLDYDRMAKLTDFVERYLDCVTPENETKMEIYFRKDQPAFIGGRVNTDLFDFSYADKIYTFVKENGMDIRLHPIVWYRHVPPQLKAYLEGRSAQDCRRLAFDFIRAFMQGLQTRYPDPYSVDVLNEIAADPDELSAMREAGDPVYEYDEDGVRIDQWYKWLGRGYYIEVLRMAREIFGDKVRLFYNDNNEGNREKQRFFKAIVENIQAYERENGVKLLDGFGMQCHFWGSEDEDRDYIEQMFSFMSRLGVELNVTEFDVSNHSTKKIQNAIFEGFIEVAPKYVEVFTAWGLNDVVSWLHEDEPTLIDRSCDFKPFTEKYIRAFSRKYELRDRRKEHE